MSEIVPCNGCTLCCKNDAVRLLPGDSTKYFVEPHPYMDGEWMLAHKPNRDCIYLGDTGCTIHETRPKMCRQMDCRTIAQKLKPEIALKLGVMAVWNKGRELLKTK